MNTHMYRKSASRYDCVLLPPAGGPLRRMCGQHWIVGILLCFLKESDSGSAVEGKFGHSLIAPCLWVCVSGVWRSASSKPHFLRPPFVALLHRVPSCQPIRFGGCWTVFLPSKRRRSGNCRNEFERALHAGSVMEKTVLESSQVKSHQPNFSSVVRIRDGKLIFDPPGCSHSVLAVSCINANSTIGRRHEAQIHTWRRWLFWEAAATLHRPGDASCALIFNITDLSWPPGQRDDPWTWTREGRS